MAAGLIFVLLPAFGYLPALGGNTFSLEPFRQLIGAPGIGKSAALSLTTGLVSGAVSLLITGLFLAGFHGHPAFVILRRLVSPLLAVPHAAAALGLSFLVAPSGLIFRLAGFDRPPALLTVHDSLGLAMMAGLVVKEVPFLMLMALAGLGQINAPARLAMARTLGYGPATAFLKTVAPALYPLMRLPMLAVIAFASSVVDVGIVLGPTNPPPLAVAVLRWSSDSELSGRFLAAAGALLQLGVTLAALGLWLVLERIVGGLARTWFEAGRRTSHDGAIAASGGLGMGLVAATAVLSLVTLTIWSFAANWRFPALLPPMLTFNNWQSLAPSLAGPLVQTLVLGVGSTLLSLIIVLAVLEDDRRRGGRTNALVSRLIYVPLVVPPVAFLFGLAVAAESLRLTPGPLIAGLGHIVFVLPYVYLSLAAPYRALDHRWSDLARTLGASEARAFLTVRLPMLLAPILTAAAVGFAVSVSQYLVTQLLGAGRVATLTTEAVALASGGEPRIVAVVALCQMLLPALAFGLAIAIPRLVWHDRRGLLVH